MNVSVPMRLGENFVPVIFALGGHAGFVVEECWNTLTLLDNGNLAFAHAKILVLFQKGYCTVVRIGTGHDAQREFAFGVLLLNG